MRAGITARTIQGVLSRSFERGDSKRTAIVFSEADVSYADLFQRSEVIVEILSKSGAKKGAHIGVLASDRRVVIAAALGILRLGCVFVPLEPTDPEPRLRVLGEIADVSHVVVDSAGIAKASAAWSDRKVTILAVDWRDVTGRRGPIESFELLDYGEDDPIYVYFTSGTSGRPKAVLGRNVGLAHFIEWQRSAFELDASVKVSQLTAPSHDPFLRDVLTPLAAGGATCVPQSRDVVLSPFELKRWINSSGVHLIHCTPTIFRNLCSASFVETDFGNLRWIFLAGEALFGRDLRTWYEVFGARISLVNLYGPTETTLAKLFHRISVRDLERGSVPLGNPIPGASIRVLDPDTRECSTGSVGELYIETAYSSLGYYKEGELNRAAFVGFSRADGAEVACYRTGDLVKRLEDGALVFVGRGDNQIKIRGNRVDPGEIEVALETIPEIKHSLVHFFDGEGDKEPPHLVAYYLAAGEVSEVVLKAHLMQRLPGFMIPDSFVRLDYLPTKINGKVDPSSLPDPKRVARELSEARDSAEQAVSPASSFEGKSEKSLKESLLSLWQEVLEIESLGVEDPFMDNGGDSLRIMLLIQRVHAEWDYELSLWDIFNDLTIDRLSKLILEAQAT